MSTSKNQKILFWENLESWIRGPVFQDLHYRGEVLSRDDREKTLDGFILLGLLWDGTCHAISDRDFQGPERWYRSFPKDLYVLLKGLGSAADQLIRWTEESTTIPLGTYDSFKQSLIPDFPWIGAVIGPIKEEIALALWGNPEAYRACLTCFKFLTKLNITSKVLEQEALMAYLEVDQSLKEPPDNREADIIASWFPRDRKGDISKAIFPHHGNGSTADAGRDLVQKYRILGTDSALHLLCIQNGLDEFQSGPTSRTAKQAFVPKSFKAYRGISMEPATLMWYQEGCNDAIVSFISHPHPLSYHYDPEDQSRNRAYAQDGSICNEENPYCTIDLSSASDSVSWSLVKSWFRHSALYAYLLLTRSRATELPDGTIYIPKKFAPMGSALNFSVETITFSAIVECVALANGAVRPDYCVYGDDIIVRKDIYDDVISRLIECGFTVNTGKSFCGLGPLRFRESCGGYYLNGYDVTPLQISRRFRGFHGSKSSWVPPAIDLANACSDSESCFARQYVIRKLLQLPKSLRPIFSEDGDRGLYSPTPTNFHLDKYYDENLQEWMWLHGGITTCYGTYSEADAPILLYEWLRIAEQRERELKKRATYDKRPLDPEQIISLPRPVLGRGGVMPARTEAQGQRWTSTKSVAVIDQG